MLRILAISAMAILAVPAAADQDQLSQKDRETAVQYLQETRTKFLSSIDGLSDAQWTFKAGPDRWSIAEVSEHIGLSEALIWKILKGQVLTSPKAAADPARPSDAKVVEIITDRSHKFQAPEVLKPTARWSTREALVKDFETERARTIDYVKTTSDDLRGHVFPHPALKEIDGYQWVLLLAAHSARHTAQIEEVKASADYPKK